jgi:hypothetical protein
VTVHTALAIHMLVTIANKEAAQPTALLIVERGKYASF